MGKVVYQAIFLDEESTKKVLEMQGEKLPKVAKDIHCTFKFNPSDKEISDFSDAVVGKEIKLRIVGYCSDGKNSGFEVELTPELEAVYTNSHTVIEGNFEKVKRTIPHITVSMAEDAKAVDTGFLDFQPIDEPFEVTGKGGFFVSDRDKGTKGVSYEKQEKIEENTTDPAKANELR